MFFNFKCQIGVLPLGTGNDLARVLGWGAALDDDNQLPKLLESFERATTKMLDRWSMMTYEIPTNQSAGMLNPTDATLINSNLNRNIPIGESVYTMNHEHLSNSNFDELKKDNDENLTHLEDSIWYHLSNMLQNENINNIIESSQILENKITEALIRVNDLYNIYNLPNEFGNPLQSKFNTSCCAKPVLDEDDSRMLSTMAAIVTDQCISVKHKLNIFFALLKNELKTSNAEDDSLSDSTNSIKSNNNVNSFDFLNKNKFTEIWSRFKILQDFLRKISKLLRNYAIFSK